MAMNFANRARIANRISNRIPFTHGNMSGASDNYESAGRLSGETRAEFSADMSRAIAEGSTAYVVKSYGTPIAWYVPLSGWSIPDVKHSPTTTHHQHVARMGAYA